MTVEKRKTLMNDLHVMNLITVKVPTLSLSHFAARLLKPIVLVFILHGGEIIEKRVI